MLQRGAAIVSKPRLQTDVLGAYVLLALLLVAYGILSPHSFGWMHLLDIVRISAALGVVAIGQTIVLLTAGLDLSVGSVIAIVAIVASQIMNGQNSHIVPAVIAAILLSLVIGLLNGLAVAWLRVPPFLATLAMGAVLEGAYLIYSGGSPKGSIAPGFLGVSDYWIGGYVPLAVVLWAVVLAICSFLVYRTTFGRRIYAVGGNPKTAWLSGIPVNLVIVLVYVLAGLCAGFAGLMAGAFNGVPSTGIGSTYTLNSIAAAVIGGASLAGGQGRLSGSVAGVLILMVLQSLLIVLNVQAAGTLVIQGIVVAAIVALNQRRRGD